MIPGRPSPSYPTTPLGTPAGGSTLIRQVTESWVEGLADTQVDTAFQIVRAITVVAVTPGSTPFLKFGGVGAQAIPIVQGEVRQDLEIEGGIFLSSPGGIGDVTLEIHGR